MDAVILPTHTQALTATISAALSTHPSPKATISAAVSTERSSLVPHEFITPSHVPSENVSGTTAGGVSSNVSQRRSSARQGVPCGMTSVVTDLMALVRVLRHLAWHSALQTLLRLGAVLPSRRSATARGWNTRGVNVTSAQQTG